jgi:hypothetical protein
MQGLAGRQITMKPAFIRPSRAKFLVVAVTMAVPPRGCGAVIFIVWSRDNPVKYTDLDGKADRSFIDGIKYFGRSVMNFIDDNDEAIGIIIVGSLQIAGGMLLKGAGITGGGAIAVGSGGTLAIAGVAVGTVAVSAGQALEVSGSITLGIGFAMIAQGNGSGNNNTEREYKDSKSGSHRDKKDDVPTWAEGKKPYANEDGKAFTKRLLDEKYGEGNYLKGPGSEYSKIHKLGDSAFE